LKWGHGWTRFHNLDVALHIEAARIRDVNDSEKDCGEERGAIEQEVAAGLFNPSYVMFSRLRRTPCFGHSV